MRTVPGETVARVRAELALRDSDPLAPATLSRIDTLLGSDLLVSGSYVAASPEQDAPLRVDIHLTGKGGIDTVLSETGSPGQVIALAASLGAKLRARLGIADAAEAPRAGARAAFPESPGAQRFYAEGLSKLRSFDLVEARRLLEKAAEEAPKNPRIRSALAACFTALGDDARAREAAQAAFDAREGLPREDRLLIEAQLAEAKNEWPSAIEDYRALHRFFPDDVEHALRLATAQISSGSAAEALETLQKTPEAQDPRITFGIGRTQFALARYGESLASARRVILLSERRGARLLVARARMLEGGSLLRTGDHRQAAASCEIARAIFAATGDRTAEAEALNRLANILFDEGSYAGAREGFERAHATWKAAGNRRGAARALANVADVDLMTGAFARATPLFEEALRTFETQGDLPEASLQWVNTGYLRYAAGDLRGAMEHAERGIAIGRTTGVMHALLPGLITRAQYELALGRATESRRDTESVLGTITAAGDLRYVGYAHQTLGDIARAVGELERARHEYERALAARRESAASGEMIESLGTLGDLCRDEGRAVQGLERLREGARLARSLSLTDEEMVSEARLARCALAAGRLEEARGAAGRASVLESRSEHLPKRLLAELASGEVALALGDVTGARGTLERARDEARRTGLVLLEGEARLLLGRLAIVAGDPDTGRTQLLTLARAADSRGLGLLSRKARALAG
jgi:tetratricopeptide (TPR) repeat protein